MSDDNNTPTSLGQKISAKFSTWLILSGWIVTLLIPVLIVGSAVYLMLMYPATALPDTLREWSGIALGFLFGNFFTVIKDFLK